MALEFWATPLTDPVVPVTVKSVASTLATPSENVTRNTTESAFVVAPAGVCRAIEVMVGALVSMVIASAEDAEDTLPAASAAVAVMLWAPELRAEPGVKLQLPATSDVVVPSVPSWDEITVIVALWTEVPEKVGVVSEVALSVSLAPRSVPAVMSGVLGADGGVVSIKTPRPADDDEVLPTASVAVAETFCTPSVIAEPGVKLQFPLPSAVVVPSVPETLEITVTVELASAVPVKVGVESLVVLSVLLEPASVPAVMSGVEGGAGAVLSSAKLSLAPVGVVLTSAFPAGVSAISCPPAKPRLTVPV